MKKENNHIESKPDTENQISFDRKIYEIHSEELGLHVPKDYFSKSKIEILEKVSNKKRKKLNIFSRETIVWSVAASIAIIFALTVFKPNLLPSIDHTPSIVSDSIDHLKNYGLAQAEPTENDILITSLFVSDNEIDEFVDNYVLEELVYEEVLPN